MQKRQTRCDMTPPPIHTYLRCGASKKSTMFVTGNFDSWFIDLSLIVGGVVGQRKKEKVIMMLMGKVGTGCKKNTADTTVPEYLRYLVLGR